MYSKAEKKASDRYSSLKSRVKVKYDLDQYWERVDFIKWYISAIKECCYCKCTEEELKKFYLIKKNNEAVKRVKRGQSLEIERKKDEEYSENNCELACYWCNNSKSDVFTYDEFQPIGKVIGIAIRKKINNE